MNVQRDRQCGRAVNLGLVANVILAVLKTTIGVIGHSPALLADGVNSTSDVAYYVVVAIFMRLSRKPADHEHPYGHSQLESIASLVVGAFVVTTGIAIFWDALDNLYDLWSGVGDYSGAAQLALWVALFTVVLKLGLTFYTRDVGMQTGSPAVSALAYDHRNDVFSASGAAIGIFLSRLGYLWFDPLVGALVALLVLRTGVEILRRSSTDLMDAVPSKELAEQISGIIGTIPEVRQVEEIYAHRFGPYLVANVTIGVDGSISVKRGDEIASRVEKLLYDSIDLLQRVYVHYHPAAESAERTPGQQQGEPDVVKEAIRTGVQ